MKCVNLNLVNSSSVSRLTKLDEELDASDPGAIEDECTRFSTLYKLWVFNFANPIIHYINH